MFGKKLEINVVVGVVLLLTMLSMILGVLVSFPKTGATIKNNIKLLQKHKLSFLKPSPKPKPSLPAIPAQSGRSVRIPILTYHYIGNNPNPLDLQRDALSVAPDKFDAEMGYLTSSGYHAINFDTLYAILNGQATMPDKPVIVTFDDGYIDFFINAFPILQKYNLSAVSFLPTGLINQGYYMSWDEVRQINNTGLVSFQAHSVTHPNMAVLNDEQIMYQLAESKKTLESMLGKPVNTFAYPFGISNSRIWQDAKRAGFVGAVGTWYGTTESEGTIYDMPRVKVSGAWDVPTFASHL